MKIFYITNARIPTEKAHGVQIMKACEAFADTGAEVELFVSDRATPFAKDPFDFYGVRKNFSIRKIKSFNAFRFEKYMGSLSFWANSVSFLVGAARLRVPHDALVYTRNTEIAWLFSKKGCRVAFEAHAWPESKGWLYGHLLAKTPYIICNSKGTENEFKTRGFKNTLAVPNGVDMQMFKVERSKSNADELKKHLGFPESKKIVMYTGHLYAWKGVDVIIGAARALRAHSNTFFALVGGTESDIRKYQELVRKEQLKNIMLCGHRKQSAIPQYLACADALLLPNIPVSRESKHYTSPIKMFEYMASRRPIIASDLPSLREVLNERNAILLPPGDAGALAEGIKKVLQGGPAIVTMVERAFADVHKYTWEKRVQKIFHFLNK